MIGHVGTPGMARRRATATPQHSSGLSPVPETAAAATKSNPVPNTVPSNPLLVLYNKMVSLIPEGLLRPYWWVYVLLTVGGLLATHLAYDSDVAQAQTSSTGDENTTLALLYPPGLMGGYRNQVIRFLAFVVHAMENGYTEILIESLLWTTKPDDYNANQWVPVPHELLFDVEYWNLHRQDLPRLVHYNKQIHTDWTTIPTTTTLEDNPHVTAVLQSGFMKPIASYAESVVRGDIVINARKIDLLPNVTHCTRPAVHGGGKGAGRLWWETMLLNSKAEQDEGKFPFDASAKLLQALVPKPEFRQVALQCVQDGTETNSRKRKIAIPYIALHARVELEMMEHKCGQTMEKNLTKIFAMVEDSLVDKSTKGVFLAVSRSGMQVQNGPGYARFQDYLDENMDTLNWIVGTGDVDDPMSRGEGLRHGQVPVFECGAGAVERYYYASNTDSPNFGSLLESMVNFHVATEATIFVGVRGSSYSTDIWTTRYHLGKGNTNYEYTPSGIKLIENGGLPPPHKTC